ncbi:MAG: phosphoribosyltransferase family protein [Gammaproteobacteria bacterium]
MDKVYISAQQLLEESFLLGSKILDSGFRPTMIMAIWRGGTPVGMAVQELLCYFGVDADHIAIRTSSYRGIGQQDAQVRVLGLDYIVDKICHDDRLLIVDDVFDSGKSIAAVMAELGRKTRANMPGDVRIAVPWFKPARNRTSLVPDYWNHETDEWLVFPHEVLGLNDEELRAKNRELHDLLAAARRPGDPS